MPVCIHADTSAQRNNSDYARRLIAANGVVMGKTRMHELAYGVTSINPVFGPVLNPYDVTKIPGGRSDYHVNFLDHDSPCLISLMNVSEAVRLDTDLSYRVHNTRDVMKILQTCCPLCRHI